MARASKGALESGDVTRGAALEFLRFTSRIALLQAEPWARVVANSSGAIRVRHFRPRPGAAVESRMRLRSDPRDERAALHRDRVRFGASGLTM